MCTIETRVALKRVRSDVPVQIMAARERTTALVLVLVLVSVF